MPVADVHIFPQALREAKPDGKKTDGRRQYLFIPEGVRRFLELVQVLPIAFRSQKSSGQEEVAAP